MLIIMLTPNSAAFGAYAGRKATDYPLSERKMQELITSKEAKRRANAFGSVWKVGNYLHSEQKMTF